MPQKVDSGANRYKWPLFANSGQIIRVSDRLGGQKLHTGGIPIIGLITAGPCMLIFTMLVALTMIRT